MKPSFARTATPTNTAATTTPTRTATPTNTPTPTATPAGTPTPATSTRLKTITFEGGSLTDPATGASDVGGTVTLASPGVKGSYAARIQTNNGFVGAQFTATNVLHSSVYVKLNAWPASTTRIVRVENQQSGGTTTVGNLVLESNGTLRLRNGTTVIGPASTALTLGTVYRIGLYQRSGTGSNGFLEAYLAVGDAPFTTPFASSLNETMTTPAVRVSVGATVGGTFDGTIDDLVLDTGTFALPSAGGAAGDMVFGDQTDSNAAGLAEAFQITASTSGAVNRLLVYLPSTNAANRLTVGLYGDNGSNAPGTLLGQTTITAPTSGAWNQGSIAAVTLAAGTKYWLAVLSPVGAGTLTFLDRTAGSVSKTSGQTNLTSLPSAWTTGTSYAHAPLTGYATYVAP